MKLTLEQFVLLVKEGLKNDCVVLFAGSPIKTINYTEPELDIETHTIGYCWRNYLSRITITLEEDNTIKFNNKDVTFFNHQATKKELLTTLDYFAN